jgi:PDZ domain
VTEKETAVRAWLRPRAHALIISLAISMAMFAPLLTGDLAPDVGVETRYVDDTWVISSVTRGGLADQAGLKSGDVVEALDGIPPGARRMMSPSLDIKGVRSWRVSRNGAQFDATVDAAAAPVETRLEPLVMFGLALVFWGSGLVVRLFKPLDELAYSY